MVQCEKKLKGSFTELPPFKQVWNCRYEIESYL